MLKSEREIKRLDNLHRSRAAKKKSGVIRVIVQGGVVQDVENVPEGMDYEIVDFDNCPECDGERCEGGSIQPCPRAVEKGGA